MKDILITILIVLVIAATGFTLGSFLAKNQSMPVGSTGMGTFNIFTGGVTNATSSVGIGATSILSLNSVSQYAKICNSGAGIVYLYLTATDTSVVAGGGMPIASSTAYENCFEIDSTNLYRGPIYGIADTTTTINLIYK